jgi:Flp pilus assembly protein TadG
VAQKARRSCGQTGVAALEFALTVPLFMMLLGAVTYFGIALYAKFVVANAANVAVRSCVAKQVGMRDDAAFQGCATSQLSAMVGSGGIYSTLCSSSSAAPSATMKPVAVGAIGQDIRLLVLTVPCNIAVSGIINGSKGYAGTNISQFNMQIVTSMPYTVYKSN